MPTAPTFSLQVLRANLYGQAMSGGLQRQRAKLEAVLADLEADPSSDRLLIFVDNALNYLGATDWSAGSIWPSEMVRMHKAGATGFFLALRRTSMSSPVEDKALKLVAATGEHAGLSMIDVLRWNN